MEEVEKDNEQVIKPDTKNTDKNIELAQESLIKSISPQNYEINSNFKSNFQSSKPQAIKYINNCIYINKDKLSNSIGLNEGLKPGNYKAKNEKISSPINQMNFSTGLKNNSGSGSGNGKNQTGQLNTQGFSSKIANIDNNNPIPTSSLKKNPDMNNFATSHLKTNNNQNFGKGLLKLNENKLVTEPNTFDKVNFPSTGFSSNKFGAGKFLSKEYK